MHCKSVAFLLACTSVPASAQLEVSWAYTVEGASTPWGDYWHDAGNIAVDPWGNVAIASYGGDEVVMNTAGAPLVIPHNTGGAGDGFVGRYHSDGTPSWGFWLGSTDFDAATGVDMDNEGNVYLGFMFEGSFDMDPGPDSAMIAPADGDRDLVIIKYDSAGHYLHAIHLVSDYNNPSAGQIERMGFDADNNLYIAGFFRNQMDLDPSTGQAIVTGNGNSDCGFVAKYSPDGQLLQYFTLPSTGYDSEVMDLVVDLDGSIFVVGIFSDSLDLDPGPGSLFIDGPNTAAFAARFDAALQPVWGRSLAATGIDHHAFAACSGLNGGLIFNGNFRGDITVTLLDGTVLNMNGGFNETSTYLAALDADGQFIWFKQFEVGQRGDFDELAAKDDGTFYGAMHFFGDFNMDPGASNFTVSTSGFPTYDMGLVRYTMAEGDFLLGHDFVGGGGINYNHVELLGSSLYMSGTYSGNLHPDIPQTANVLTPGGLALIKYCHVPENITYSVQGDTLFLCPGADTLIVAAGAEQFLWYDTLVGGVPIGSGDTLLLPSVDQSVTVYVEGVNGICVSQRVPIHVVLRPQVALSMDSLTICQGDTVVLGYAGIADVFTPSLPQAFFATGYVPLTDLAIWMVATDLTNGCTAADTVFIHVLPLPNVSLALAPDSICLFGNSVTLGGGGPAGGAWEGEGVVNDTLWSPLESGPGDFPVTYTVVDGNGCAASAVDIMEVAVCFSGIADQPALDGISIGPNPFTDALALRSRTDVRYVVYNAVGAELLSGTARGGALTSMGTSHLAAGLYTVRVSAVDGTGGRVFKLVKE
jgi:hypothetical protein